jgi:polysaccharide deacetylase 2 family uncharacterized protein YibQ
MLPPPLTPPRRRRSAVPAPALLLVLLPAIALGLAGCGPSERDREAEPAAQRARPVPPRTEPVPPSPPSLTDLLGPLDVPTIAIVVDDWGHRRDATTRGFAELDFPLTFSILPGLRFSRQDALQATPLALPDRDGPDGAAVAPPSRRREIMLHLPMEPEGYPDQDPGPDPLRLGMDRGQVAAILDAALAGVPGARGLNNHMGSAATADPALMAALADELAARDLFFVDSLTTPRSVAARRMREAGVPTLVNRIFLDQSTTSREQVRELLARLVKSARARGAAVGLCHPYPETLAILSEELPRLREQGLRLVTVSELLALEAARRDATGMLP